MEQLSAREGRIIVTDETADKMCIENLATKRHRKWIF